MVCTNRDPAGRRRAVDLLSDVAERVFPVGRLDVDSQGLVLMTNDGGLAQRLAHPRYGVEKVYVAEVKGKVDTAATAKLISGVRLAEGKACASRVKIVQRGSDKSVLEITLCEGRNRQVRRMFDFIGHPVIHLQRVAIGPISIGGLHPGQWRHLTREEVARLRGEG